MPRILDEEVLATIYNYIDDHIQAKGYPPLYREIGQAVQIDSSKTVPRYLNEMVKRGMINFRKHTARSIELL